MKNRALLAGLVMSLMVLSAFAALPAKTASAAAEGEDVLYIAMQEDMEDFNNYNLASNSVWKYYVIGMGFESLATADYDLTPIKLLAEDWDFDEATLTVDIKLREGVLFHDLTEMTAEDVHFSYLMARNGTTYSGNLIPAFDANDDNIVNETELNNGITIVDDYNLKMTMAKPYGQFFSSTLGVPIVPKHVWDVDVGDEGGVDPVTKEVVVTWSDETAAIGTGAWYYAEGVTSSYRVMKKFDSYWGVDYEAPGVDFTTPWGMPTVPKVVDAVHYKIYTSIDTAILALQAGDVDYIAWAVTAGRVPALQTNPNIELEYMSDAGYFYLAFNMKKEPMNNISFRKAVSHLIDKDQLVDVYMGGFGKAGSAAVSPFFGEWHNPTVTTYAFDIAEANRLLDDAGYLDINGDGWRQMPDGTLIEKITLLTPPADYDPIRIRAGQMIATNMREVGINVDAKPIDFNTLVAKLVAFDYQMLIIGWSFSGYTECVSVLYDIYGAAAASNNWAFWSDTNSNPLYEDLGGVSTLADERTMELVDEFSELEDLARETFYVAEQIDYVKQGQAIIADAVPCNILYYRVNVEAHGKVWTNWTQFDGTLMNSYNLCTLEYSGTGGTTGGGVVTTSLSTGLTIPEKVKCDQSVDAYVKAIDNLGNPVAEADVEVNVTSGATATPVNGTTDDNGVFEFALTGNASGVSTVTATVTSGALVATDSTDVLITSLGGIGVEVIPAKTVLDPAEDVEISVRVTDVNGDPVEGAAVTIDPYLLGYGSISPSTGTVVTDADGSGTMTYSAPDESTQNQHLLVTLAASVSHPKYTLSNLAASSIVVYNDAAPEWVITSIESVTTTALNPTSNEATISVLLTDDEGTPMGGETLDVVYSDESLVTSPVNVVTTATDGTADLVVTMEDTGASGALRVTVGMLIVANSITDTVTLTYVDPADPPTDPMYGGYIQFSTEKYIDALESIDVTVHVFDSDGAPADGVNATVIVPATAYGQMVDWDGSEFNSLWEYVGVSITTEADGQSISTAGSMASAFVGRAADYGDFWYEYIPTGVVITAGVYEMTLNGVDLASLDLINSIHVLPGSWSTAEFDGPEDFGARDDWGPWPLNYYSWGQTVISSSLAYGRAMELTTVVYEIDKPVLEAKASEFDETTVTVTAYDEDNNPIVGAELSIYGDTGDFNVTPDSSVSGAGGEATFNIVAAAYNDVSEDYDAVTRATNPTVYIRADVDVEGSMALFSQTQLVIEPFMESVYLELQPLLDVYNIGSLVRMSAKVVDQNGDPYADLPVSIDISGVGTVLTPTLQTDEGGNVTLVIDTAGIADVSAAVIASTLTTGGTPEGATARMTAALQNIGPDIAIGSPTADGEVEGDNASVEAAIFDFNGVAEATLTVDGGTPINLVGAEGSMDTVWVSEVLDDLDEGEHTIVISATDTLGAASEEEITFKLVEDEGADMLAWGLAAIGWLIAVIALVMVVKYKPKKEPQTGLVEPPEDEPVLEPLGEEKTE